MSGPLDKRTPGDRVASQAEVNAAIYQGRLDAEDAALSWRGLDRETCCRTCGGTGSRAYPSTALWRGGIGGQSFTTGVCDACWGSGDRCQPWTDLRLLERTMDRKIAERAVDLLAQSAGAELCVLAPAVREVIAILRREGDRRAQSRKQVEGLPNLLRRLADTIERGIKERT